MAFTDRGQIFVTDTTGRTRRQVTTDGGTAPTWGPGNALYFYVRASETFFSMDLSRFPGTLGRPLPLVRASTPLPMQFAVGRDGRLLIVQPDPEDLAPPRLEVTLNWFTELRRQVAAQ